MSDQEEVEAKKMKMKEEPVAVEPKEAKHCQYWVKKKKRFCKMTIGE